jgi:hypothetical protein
MSRSSYRNNTFIIYYAILFRAVTQKIVDADADISFSTETVDGAPTLVEIFSSPLQADVVEALGWLAVNNPAAQDALASIHGASEVIVQLYDNDSYYGNDDGSGTARHQHRHRIMELATTYAVAKLVTGHPELQSCFVATGITPRLVAMLRRTGGDVTTLEAAVEAIWRLADGNADVQRKFISGPDIGSGDEAPSSARSAGLAIADSDTDDVIAALLDVAIRPPNLHQIRTLAKENVSIQRSNYFHIKLEMN